MMKRVFPRFGAWIKGHRRGAMVALACIATVSAVGLVLATQSSVTVHMSWTVLPYQELQIAGSGTHGPSVTADYVMPQPEDYDLQRGYIEEMNSVALTVNSNIPWKVQVWTDETDMGQSDDKTFTKPISDFLLREHGGEYFPISNTPQILASGNRGSFDIGVDHRILLGSDYRPGSYGLEVVYTVMPK